MNVAEISSLPGEVLVNIFKYIADKDIEQLSKRNNFYHEFIFKNKEYIISEYYKNFTRKIKYNNIEPYIRKYIPKSMFGYEYILVRYEGSIITIKNVDHKIGSSYYRTSNILAVSILKVDYKRGYNKLYPILNGTFIYEYVLMNNVLVNQQQVIVQLKKEVEMLLNYDNTFIKDDYIPTIRLISRNMLYF